MSQASQLNLYFVLPKEDNNAECSKDMHDAFAMARQYSGRPEWVLPSFCLRHKPLLNDVFVFDEFKGLAFNKLKENSAKMLGSRCMVTCLTAGDCIPPGTSPVFTEGMRGLVVCCTGFDTAAKKHIQERVEYMGGNFQSALRSCVTHVVAFNNTSLKAIEAYKTKKKIMTLEWVDAVWKRSLETNVRGDDSEFSRYVSPLFHNLKITTSGIGKRIKEELKNLIHKNGGTFMGTLEMNTTNILVIEKPEGDKYKAALDWEIQCVTSKWLKDCVELARILPFDNYKLKKLAKASTPNKDTVNFTGNFSMLSVIEHDVPNASHVEETVNVTLSQPASTSRPLTQPARDANADLIEKIVETSSGAGQFLDGCNILMHGFSAAVLEKLRKVLNIAGATRFDEPTSAVTHVIVAGAVPEFLKSKPAHILPLEWVVESMMLKRPAPVDSYVLGDAVKKPAPASPLSKQGARLLSRNDSRQEEPEDIPPEMAFEDDLVHRYQLSQQGAPIDERPAVTLTPRQVSNCSSRSDALTPTNTELFHGLKFFLSKDLSEEELEGSGETITKFGGVVVTRKFTGVADFAIVPLAGASLSETTAHEVVNVLYIKDCVVENRRLPIQYYHQTFAWVRGSKPLTGCVVCVTKYLGVERDFIELIIETLGGIAQDILAKRKKNDILQTTHLICTEPSGTKYEGAVRWGVPVVHHNWLLKCAELGQRLSEEPYLLAECKSIASATNSSATMNRDTPIKPAHNSNSSNLLRNVTNRTPVPTTSAGASKESVQNITNRPLGPTTSTGPSKETVQNTSNPTLAGISKEIVHDEDSSDGNPFTSRRAACTRQSQSGGLTTSMGGIVRKAPLEVSQQIVDHASQSPAKAIPAKVLQTDSMASPVNKALERLRGKETPKNSLSPDLNRTVTPNTPLGACFGNDNPSPGTRKRLLKWMNQGAQLSPYPSPKRTQREETQSTPISELLGRQLKLMMRRPEDQPPDDSPEPAAKRLHLSSLENAESLAIDLQRMKEIEASYEKTVKLVEEPTAQKTLTQEAHLVLVTESQPHTEIGWDDPTDKVVALASLERAAAQIAERPVKTFMISGLADNDELENAKKIILASGGKVSAEACFDRTATHLLAGPTLSRAEKLMGSMASGLWILHPKYLTALAATKDVYAIKDEDYEWGNPSLSFDMGVLKQNVQECIVSAYKWRIDIQVHKKPKVFEGMKIVLKLTPQKQEVFHRLVEAGGGEVKTLENQKPGERVYCVWDINQSMSAKEMENYAKRNICCVHTLFLSDMFSRKQNVVEANMLQDFMKYWTKYQI